ncbi:MAG: DNA gyrase subunit A [Pseudomonadota bacterium]
MEHSAEIIPINIEDEMKASYLDYAMSVIIGRAIPDIRDGLKPVHRRILYAMYREGLLSNKRYSKCAGVVGEVLKKYHPHGDAAVYDTLVRMAQPWSMRYPLIDGQGNFGSIDGDSAAAYRYTEAKLMAIAEQLLQDIDENTVDFIPNFDGSVQEPVVLPSRIPTLLINGSDGIAVGMATKVPPHNLSEIVDGLVALIDNPQIEIKGLLKFVKGPDFPTGGFINGTEGINKAYLTGRGSIQMSARAMIERMAKGDKELIVVTEIPYQVNKARLIERIAFLVQNNKLQNVVDIRDESDRDGMRIVVELKRGAVAQVVMNQLFAHTALKSSYGIILLAIVNGQPKLLNLKQALQHFLDHRREVILRRTSFRLSEAEKRLHILEGLKIAIEAIDEIIALIKKSKEPAIARDGLMKVFKLSEIQAQAILDMRLQRLTGLEREKIINEYESVQKLIIEFKAILEDETLQFKIIKDELLEIKTKFGDQRRTEITGVLMDDVSVEDLIQEEEMVVTITHKGYIKRNPISIYRAQRRGGRGKTGMATREEDFVESLFVASTHHYIMIFTQSGRVFWLKVHELPQVGRVAKGQAISSLVRMAGDDHLAAVLPVREFKEGQYVVMATQKGVIKKTDLMSFSNPRAGGINAITINDGDKLISVHQTNGQQEVLMSTKDGLAIRFPEKNVRAMGRSAAGVKGITLSKDDLVVGMDVLDEHASILTVTENGYGKRTALDEYRVQSRGGRGIITIKVSERNGRVVSVSQVMDKNDIMLVTDQGKIIRSCVKGIPVIGRNTQGVRLISLEKGERVVSSARVEEEEAAEQE